MIIHDGKKTAGVILSKMKDGVDMPAPSEPSDDHEDLKAIAEDLMKAIEMKDHAGLVMALQAFMGCIEDADEEQDAEQE